MPYYNGNYMAPIWVNNQPPAINQTELLAMSQTIEESQILTGSGAPTQYVSGKVGQRYADTTTTPYTIYKLVKAAEDANVWEPDNADGNLALDYDSSSPYDEGDFCIHGGLLYKANTDISSPEAWNAAHWTRTWLADELAAHIADVQNPHNVTAAQTGAYVKPAGGIPASDLASGVIPTVPTPSDATPQNLGVAAAGSSADYSRADHVHEKPTYTKSDVGLSNVADVLQYSASNKPTAADVTYNGTIGIIAVTNVKGALDAMPKGSNATPYADSSPGSAGTSEDFARADHIHPSDPSKVPTTRRINNSPLSGDLLLFRGGAISFSANWSGNGPYTQVVSMNTVSVWGDITTAITSKSVVILQPTAAQIAQLMSDGVTALTIENNSGTLTAYAFGAAPTTSMTIDSTILEVET